LQELLPCASDAGRAAQLYFDFPQQLQLTLEQQVMLESLFKKAVVLINQASTQVIYLRSSDS